MLEMFLQCRHRSVNSILLLLTRSQGHRLRNSELALAVALAIGGHEAPTGLFTIVKIVSLKQS